MILQPRPYQSRAVQNTFDGWQHVESGFIHGATGCGKTVIALMVCQQALKANPKARILFISHTTELVTQPIDKVYDLFPDLVNVGIGIIYGKKKRFLDCQIVSASYQTLISRDFAYLKALVKHGGVDIVIEDECHHAVSPKRIEIHKTLKEMGCNYKILGLSATPARTDGKPLTALFNKQFDQVSMHTLIAYGYLTEFTIVKADLPDVDFSKLKKNGVGQFRDYSTEAVSSLMDVDNVYEISYTKWLEVAQDRSTLCFAPKVDMSHHLCEYFASKGVSCAVVVGDKKKTGVYVNNIFVKKERKALIDSFKIGEIKILFNCMALTEGFDAPITSCVMILRPTSSDPLIKQMIGRALRLHPDKPDVSLILSFVPINFKGLNDGTALELEVKKKKAQDENMIAKELGELVKEDFKLGIKVDPDQVTLTTIDFLKKSDFAWLTHNGLSVASTGANATHRDPYRTGVAILINSKQAVKKSKEYLNGTQKEFANKEGERYAVMAFKYHESGKGEVSLVCIRRTFEGAKIKAEYFLAGRRGGDRFNASAEWRKRTKASEKMKKKLDNWGIKLHDDNYPTDRGSRLIYWICAYNLMLKK